VHIQGTNWSIVEPLEDTLIYGHVPLVYTNQPITFLFDDHGYFHHSSLLNMALHVIATVLFEVIVQNNLINLSGLT